MTNYISKRKFLSRVTKTIYSICGLSVFRNPIFGQNETVDGDPCHVIGYRTHPEAWKNCNMTGRTAFLQPPLESSDLKKKGFWQGCCLYCATKRFDLKMYRCCTYTDYCSSTPAFEGQDPSPDWCSGEPHIYYKGTYITWKGEWKDDPSCGGGCNKNG
jgi:hypothetical protein